GPPVDTTRQADSMGDRPLRKPTTGIAGCCPHARFTFTASSRQPPPIRAMNSRRVVSGMGSSPEPAVPAYRRLSMHRKRPQVLGVDLNRSESVGPGPLLSLFAPMAARVCRHPEFG